MDGTRGHTRDVPIVQLGLGGVGQSLIEQVIAADAEGLSGRRWRASPRWLAIADSRGFLYQPEGLHSAILRQALDRKRAGSSLEEVDGFTAGATDVLLASILNRSDVPGIVVDVTAAMGMEETLLNALERQWGVVLANKRPLTSSHEVFAGLKDSGRIRHEATVGAGIPAVSTIDYLLDTGDTVTSIEGCLSGTLGYLCTALQDEEPFSRALAEAKAAGYTEPDPREDLSGLDVARKALILARMLGWALEMDDVQVEPLYPPAMATMPVEQFMRSAAALDEPYARRAAEARERGCVPRCVARIKDGQCIVGLQDVSVDELTGNLRGTDNIVAIRTERYSASPLVVAGAGAGREVTAAGVLGDVLSLAREMAIPGASG